MALVPISNILPFYDPEVYGNWWLKFYNPGTTTPITMATDNTGATTLAKAELDGTTGFPQTAGGANFIPFLEGFFDAWIFPTEAEADANDTTNAVQVSDNISADNASSLSPSDIGAPAVYNSVAAAIAATLESGAVVQTTGYYSVNDGGGAFYHVQTAAEFGGTPDEIGGSFTLSNGNVAVLIPDVEGRNIRQYGCKTDGTDCSPGINKALTDSAGSVLYVPPGVYTIASKLSVPSKTRWYGAGMDTSIIVLDAAFDSATPAWTNTILTGAALTYGDEKIHIEDLGFDGNENLGRTVAMASLVRVKNCSVNRCRFWDHRYICLEIGTSRDVEVNRCVFENNGRPQPTTEGGACIWTDQIGGEASFNINVTKNVFRNNLWSAAYYMPTGGSFSDNDAYSNGESSLFCNQNAINVRITGNHIEGSIKQQISASGIEFGGTQAVISGNHLINNESDGISLTDVENVTVSDNTIFSNGQDPVSFPTASGISVIAVGATVTDHVNIHNNRIGDRQGTKTQNSGISVGGSGSELRHVTIHHNDLTDQRTNGIDIDPTKWGAFSWYADNTDSAGLLQRPFVVVAFSLTGAGNRVINSIGFRPRCIEFHAVVSASGTQLASSIGYYDALSSECHSISRDATGQSGLISSTKVINIIDGLATVIFCDATIVSLDSFGFTINVGTFTSVTQVIAKCYR